MIEDFIADMDGAGGETDFLDEGAKRAGLKQHRKAEQDRDRGAEMCAEKITCEQQDNDEADDDEPDANDPALLLPQILIFDRAEYDVALADTEGFISRPGWHRETPEAAEGDDGRQGILGPSVWLDRLRNRFTSSWDS